MEREDCPSSAALQHCSTACVVSRGGVSSAGGGAGRCHNIRRRNKTPQITHTLHAAHKTHWVSGTRNRETKSSISKYKIKPSFTSYICPRYKSVQIWPTSGLLSHERLPYVSLYKEEVVLTHGPEHQLTRALSPRLRCQPGHQACNVPCRGQDRAATCNNTAHSQL